VKKTVIILLFLIVLQSLTAIGQKAINFPLSKGNYWVYEGKVKWTSSGSSTVKEKEVQWKMEVTDVIKREHLTAAIIKGYPLDLAWYSDSTKRGNYIILFDSTRYHLIEEYHFKEVLTRLQNGKDSLQNIATNDNLLLDFPLNKDKIFPDASMTHDVMYNWVVDDILLLGKSKQYIVSYRSHPDYISFQFSLGKGITRFKYHHNGTISEFDVKLVDSKIN
jgi:hypothetical protein